MNESQILCLGARLLGKYKLWDWTIGIGHCPYHLFAQCHGGLQLIVLDYRIVGFSRYRVQGTILHEVAHALVGYDRWDGHGPRWAAKAAELGVPRWDILRHNNPPRRVVKY